MRTAASAMGATDETGTWQPDPAAAAQTRIGALIQSTGSASFEALRDRSIEDPEWFWSTVVDDLGLPFTTRWSKVLDTSRGAPFARWFEGGRLNAAEICLDRHARDRPDDRALTWEGEDGETRVWTWRELRAEADALAALLAERGIGKGDAVGIFMPMIPETVAALFGVAKLGAVFLPVFSGYAAEAIALRLADAGAKALITADGFWRRGRQVDTLEVADAAADAVPSVTTVVVVPRLGRNDGPTTGGRDVAWPALATGEFATVAVDSEHTMFIAYTSGTTGRPKGSVHVHGGFVVKVAEEVAYQFDCGAGDTLFWFTDMGWIMGPWEVFGGLANGATIALFEGAPDYPGPSRLWEFVANHGVTALGISPTLIRALMPHGDAPVCDQDLSALRVLGSTGEPWNEGPWRWYSEVVGQGRCPVINISGGTEVGACFLSPHPVHPISPTSLGGPSLGMAVDVYDDEGQPLRGAVGELVCTKPWPGMTRGLYQDEARYLDVYWSRYPGVWWHGDFASIEDGQWYLHGRSDDTIKVAGKRLGPAEAESVLVSHPAVIEAAAVGMDHEIKGESLWCYVVIAPGTEVGEDLRRELIDLVAERLGKAFRPETVRFTTALPKTRNAKILRRAIRTAASGADPGDLSALEDPATIEAIKAAT